MPEFHSDKVFSLDSCSEYFVQSSHILTFHRACHNLTFKMKTYIMNLYVHSQLLYLHFYNLGTGFK